MLPFINFISYVLSIILPFYETIFNYKKPTYLLEDFHFSDLPLEPVAVQCTFKHT